MDLINTIMNWVVPPATMIMLACAWPALCFLSSCEWLYKSFYKEDMEDKVVVITGASSAIGEQLAYEYARRKANLVLVAKRESRLRVTAENARYFGAKHVMIVGADVIKEDECRRFIAEVVNFHGRVDHLVNTASLGHSFYLEEVADTSVFHHLLDINFWGNVYPTVAALPYLHQSNGRIIVNAAVESWLPLPRMSLYSAAKTALINFYETLRFEVNDDVGITIATHGWIGSEMTRGKFMQEDGAEMQWKDDYEGNGSSGAMEQYARRIVAGACRGEQHVKYPSWYDVFFVYRAFVPSVLNWTFKLLLSNATRRFYIADSAGRLELEGASRRRQLTSGSISISPMSSPPRVY